MRLLRETKEINTFFSQEKRPYDFEYNVKDDYAGTDFGHNEESDGNTVRGSYTVQLPDGRKQTVNTHKNNNHNDVKIYYNVTSIPTTPRMPNSN